MSDIDFDNRAIKRVMELAEDKVLGDLLAKMHSTGRFFNSVCDLDNLDALSQLIIFSKNGYALPHSLIEKVHVSESTIPRILKHPRIHEIVAYIIASDRDVYNYRGLFTKRAGMFEELNLSLVLKCAKDNPQFQTTILTWQKDIYVEKLRPNHEEICNELILKDILMITKEMFYELSENYSENIKICETLLKLPDKYYVNGKEETLVFIVGEKRVSPYVKNLILEYYYDNDGFYKANSKVIWKSICINNVDIIIRKLHELDLLSTYLNREDGKEEKKGKFIKIMKTLRKLIRHTKSENEIEKILSYYESPLLPLKCDQKKNVNVS